MARILVAEHNQSTASYLRSTLKKSGHTVCVADNCLNAWRAVSQGNFDIFMVDISMPGVDGFVLAQKALQDNSLLHVIFITGFAAVALDTQATLPYAPTPVTSSPFHLTGIAACVRYLTGQSNLPLKSARVEIDNNIIYLDFQGNNQKQSCV